MSLLGSKRLGQVVTLEALARISWYLLTAYLAIAYARGPLVSAWPDPFAVIQFLIGLFLLVAVLLLVPAALRAISATSVPQGHAFPSSVTVVVGVWLAVFSLASAAALLLALFPPSWLMAQLRAWGLIANASLTSEADRALITLFAAAVGSAITTIEGYLKHASTEANFKTSYAPWYVARPLMGMLLGLLFYLVLKAGLLLLGTGSAPGSNEAMSRWGLAAIGGLVGLSSKNAIEKLKEVFQTMFRTATPEKAEEESLNGDWTAPQLDALIAGPD